MSAENIISRLDKVRKTGADKWQACCPGPMHKHGDRSPSLSVRETPDGVILLKCWAGCSNGEILQAIGCDFVDLFPTTASFHLPKMRRAFSARDALIGLTFEVLVLLQFANAMATGAVLTDADRARLLLSATRIQRAREATL